MPNYLTILYEKRPDDRIAIITLNRPPMNPVSRTLETELMAALAEADNDPEVRAMVVTGSGDRAFSPGADMAGQRGYEISTGSKIYDRYLEDDRNYEDFHRLHRLSKPVIAAINGYCLGRGFEWAIQMDMLIAADHAIFGAPETRMGTCVGTVLPFLVGPQWAKRIILTGDWVSAKTAKEIGLVIDVVPREQLMEKAIELAKRIAYVPPEAVRVNKRMLDGVMDVIGYETAYQYAMMMSVIGHTIGEIQKAPDGRTFDQMRQDAGSTRAYIAERDKPFGRVPL